MQLYFLDYCLVPLSLAAKQPGVSCCKVRGQRQGGRKVSGLSGPMALALVCTYGLIGSDERLKSVSEAAGPVILPCQDWVSSRGLIPRRGRPCHCQNQPIQV